VGLRCGGVVHVAGPGAGLYAPQLHSAFFELVHSEFGVAWRVTSIETSNSRRTGTEQLLCSHSHNRISLSIMSPHGRKQRRDYWKTVPTFVLRRVITMIA
jgi:hypothetical protein